MIDKLVFLQSKNVLQSAQSSNSSIAAEQAAEDATRKIPSDTARIHSVGSQTGCVTEFIAAREGERICDC